MTENEHTERDTHFAGFAEVLRKKMHFSDFALYHAGKSKIEVEQAQRQILAQGLYDFVYHLLDNAPYHSGSFDVGWGTPGEIREAITSLPDLTECPTSPDE